MEHALGVALEGVEVGGLHDRTLGWADRPELQLQQLEDELGAAFLPTFLPTFLSTFLSTFLPSLLPTLLSTFLPALLPPAFVSHVEHHVEKASHRNILLVDSLHDRAQGLMALGSAREKPRE